MNSLLQNKGETVIASTPEIARAHVDSTLKYFLIFLVLGFGSSIGFSYLLALFSVEPSGIALLKAAGAGCGFLIVALFQSFFIRSFYFNLILAVIDTAGLFGFFFRPFSMWFIIAGLAFIFFWAIGFNQAKTQLNSAMKVSFWRYSSTLLTSSITGLALLVALLYAGLYQRSGQISYQSFRFVVGSTGLEYAVPNFSPDTSIDAFFRSYAQQALLNDPRFSSLSQAEKDRMAQTIGNSLADQAGEATTVSVNKGESIGEYGYRLIQAGLKSMQDRGLGALAIGAILAIIFFAIKGVMFFIKWPLLLIAMFIYFMLLAIGAISIESEQRQKEVVVIH